MPPERPPPLTRARAQLCGSFNNDIEHEFMPGPRKAPWGRGACGGNPAAPSEKGDVEGGWGGPAV